MTTAFNRQLTVTVDAARCTGCGRCVEVCPVETLSLRGGKAVVTGSHSINCGHCAAVCPMKAITVAALAESGRPFKTLPAAALDYVGPGQSDAAALAALMRSRRSCREYLDKAVALATLEDLVRLGTTAPSGTNSQLWSFTIFPTRGRVVQLGDAVARFYRRLNRLAHDPLLRVGLCLLGNRRLATYHQLHLAQVEKALDQYDKDGRDRLFHGAPAVLVIGAMPGASTPQDDALLAAQNIQLAAHAMGLGTCLIGFASEAMKRDRRIQVAVGIPKAESIYAVLTVGWPATVFQRTTGRRTITPRIVT